MGNLNYPNNDGTRSELAEKVVDLWDLETLVSAMIESLIADYKYANDVFQYDWNSIMVEK